MASLKTKGNVPQVDRTGNVKFHTLNKVCPKDSGGGKSSLFQSQKSAKSLQQRIVKLNIGTYNIRSMNKDEKIYELEEELSKIKWDIIGLAETRRKGESRIHLRSGNLLYCKGNEDNSNFGIGFIINKRLTRQIQTIKGISERVAYLIMKIKRITLKIIQVYAPTTDYDDDSIESFYEDISRAMDEEKTRFTLVIGDFNAKLGERLNNDETKMGNYGYGKRNDRGVILMNYLEERRLFAMNSFFKKKPKRKWTWISPNGTTRNEIDYILSTEKSIIRDVTVINQCTTGSDHRMVRAKININATLELTKKMKKDKEQLDMEKLKQNKHSYKDKIKEQLTKNLDPNNRNINEINNILSDTVLTAAKEIAQKDEGKESYISQQTKDLMTKRRKLAEEGKTKSIEFTEINKTIRKNIKNDKRKIQEAKVEEIIEKNKNMKSLRPSLGKFEINKIKNEKQIEIHDRNKIIEIIHQYYTNLYQTKEAPPEDIKRRLKTKIKNVNSEIQPEISKSEIKKALKELKNNKAPGQDGMTAEMLKNGGKIITNTLYTLMNQIMQEKKIPDSWNESITIILHKKGDRSDLKNYRPITLLNILYKLFTKILTSRLTTKFDGYQSKEQAGFRKGFSTADHLLTMKILIEKANEYHIPMFIALVDFEKAFDCVEHWAVINALQNSRIDYRYTDLIENLYRNGSTRIKVFEGTEPIRLRRGVRQGDTISPKLFNQSLEDVFKKLHWEEKGIKINGQYLNHLRYADDVILIANTKTDLKVMLEELDDEAKKIGLKMNYNKTKTMTNTDENTAITMGENTIEQVGEYIYLGQLIKLNKENQTAEIKRRVRLAWAAFGKLSFVLKNKKYPQYLKTRIFNQCILPVLTYGSQVWTLTKANIDKIAKAQRSMERQMLHIKLQDRKRNEYIREVTKVRDATEQIAKLKWKFAGHTIRQKDERWNKQIIYWRPWEHKRGRGRPQMRWSDDLKKHAGSRWMTTALDRDQWRKQGEAYVQKWTE